MSELLIQRARNVVGGRRHLHSCIAARREGDGPRSILSLIVASDDGMDYALSSLSYGVFIQVNRRLPWRAVGPREFLRERRWADTSCECLSISSP